MSHTGQSFPVGNGFNVPGNPSGTEGASVDPPAGGWQVQGSFPHGNPANLAPVAAGNIGLRGPVTGVSFDDPTPALGREAVNLHGWQRVGSDSINSASPADSDGSTSSGYCRIE